MLACTKWTGGYICGILQYLVKLWCHFHCITIKKYIVYQSDLILRQDSSDPKPHRRKSVPCYCSLWIPAVVITQPGANRVPTQYSVVERSNRCTETRWCNYVQQECSYYQRSKSVLWWYRQLKLKSVPGVPLWDSVMRLYQFNSSCDHLPTDNNIDK